MLTLRSRADVEAEHDRAVATIEAGPSTALDARLARHQHAAMSAARDSLAWVLGYTAEAPWTQRPLPNPTPQQIYSEWAQAETVNHNSALMAKDEYRWWYGSAVEHALAWARGSDTSPPASPYGY
jgi:hypothetical protein